MQAWAEGKIIQFRKKGTVQWVDLYEDDLRVSSAYHYRIKPKPKYRPFKNQEECWNEMHKHPNFGYIKNIVRDEIVQIMRISDEVLNVLDYTISPYDFELAFQTFVFTDGEPFGVKEE